MPFDAENTTTCQKEFHPLGKFEGRDGTITEKSERKKKKRKVVKIHRPRKNKDKETKVIRVENSKMPEVNVNVGVYLPPHKAQKMEAKKALVTNSVEYQRKAWQALRGSINMCVNRVDATNIQDLVVDIFKENLIWGKGVFCRTIFRSQMAAPGYSNVLAAILAVVNTKMPEIGELMVKRVIMQFQRAYRRNEKVLMNSIVMFFAHLVNQYVIHELIALELLSLLLEKPTDDSVEVAITFIKQCGSRLSELIPRGVYAVFEAFRTIVNEGKVSKRVQYSIEGLYNVYRDKFSEYPAIVASLDLVNEEDTIVHEFHIKDKHDIEENLDVFRAMDPKEYAEQEKLYEEIKNEILAESSEEEDEGEIEDGGDGRIDYDYEAEARERENGNEREPDPVRVERKLLIEDCTGTDLVNLRRDIYLTIMSSLTFEEAAHKMMKIKIRPGEEPLVAQMVLDCCANERSYQRDIGLLGERICKLSSKYADSFDDLFGKQYTIIHRYETTKLRNIARFFAHLIFTGAIGWDVLEYIKLTEVDTTSSSRIFIKVLFQELAYWLGLQDFKAKLQEDSLAKPLKGIFPKENPKDTRFAINFFTTIGLGALTTQLREHLEKMQNTIRENKVRELGDSDSSEDTDSSDDSSSLDSDDSDSSENSNESSSDDSSSSACDSTE